LPLWSQPRADGELRFKNKALALLVRFTMFPTHAKPKMKKLICSPLTGLALLLSLLMPTASFGVDKKLEVFSWWTSGGEAAALDALFQDVKILI
jgi:hypothetical protein